MTVAKVTKPESSGAAETVSRILTEDVLSIKQARAEWENMTGKRPDKATFGRWIHKGVGGTKLEAIRMGGRDLYTSLQALTRFAVARTNALQNGGAK